MHIFNAFSNRRKKKLLSAIERLSVCVIATNRPHTKVHLTTEVRCIYKHFQKESAMHMSMFMLPTLIFSHKCDRFMKLRCTLNAVAIYRCNSQNRKFENGKQFNKCSLFKPVKSVIESSSNGFHNGLVCHWIDYHHWSLYHPWVMLS